MAEMTNPPKPPNHAIAVPSSKSYALQQGNMPHGGGQSTQAITAGFVFTALRRWWKVAGPIGLVLAGITGALVYFLFEPVYEASALLRIDEASPFIVIESNERSQRFVETQLELIRDPLVLGPAVSQEEVSRLPEFRENISPIEWLSKEIRVRPVGRSNLYEVSIQGTQSESVARIVNAIVDAYFALRVQEDAKQVESILTLLDGEKKRRQSEVERLRSDVRELTLQATPNDPSVAVPDPDSTLNRSLLTDLESRLITAEMEQEILAARIKLLEKLTSEPQLEVSEAAIKAAIDDDVNVQEVKALIAAKQSTLHEIESKALGGRKSAAYQQKRREIGQDLVRLAEVRAEVATRIRAGMEDDLRKQRNDELASVKTELERYRLLESLLRDRYDRELGKVKQFSGDTLDLEFKRAELARAGEILNLIAERRMSLDDKGRAPSRVALMRRAEKPVAPVKYPYNLMALVSLASLCLPFVLAVFWERIVLRVSDPEQLEQHSTITIVGETPRLPVRTGFSRAAPSKRVGRELGCFEESIDGLRTCLMLSEPLKNMKTLAVTSATTREGKTSVAAQLAVSIARASGALTLLIDGDMRSPDIHNVFEVRLEPGLAEVLGHDCRLEDAIVTSWSKCVHVLPAGRLHTSPHKLLGNGALKSLLDGVRASYDYIIIDTPPIFAASEALVLAKTADATLMCAMQDVSRIDQVRKAYDRLVAAGTCPVGTVLNGVPTQRYAHRYGSYAYYHNR